MMKTSTEANIRSILLIYTGGTIGMVEHPNTGVLAPLNFDYMVDNLPEIQRIGCKITVEQLSQPIDSSSITPEAWVWLARLIEKHYHAYDGFVVLHGTDTMAYTASALSFMLEGLAKPIVFTGSQLPIGRLRTDGKENLINAIEIASAYGEDGAPRVPEVCLFFENYLMRANRSTKVSADQFGAFESPNYPRLAYSGIDIRYNEAFIHREVVDTPFRINTEMDTRVAVLKLFPGIGQEVVEALLELPSLRGLVLETYGSGNAPMSEWFLSALRRAVERGVVIVNVTQCATGYVDMLRYETGHLLHSIGLVSGRDCTTESAVVKLMNLLGRNYSIEEVKKLMEQPLRGELSVGYRERDFHNWMF